jgi:hypothetical protein
VEAETVSCLEFKEWEANLTTKFDKLAKTHEKTKLNLLTLENYCERYAPLVTLNTILEMMAPVTVDT